MSPVMILVKEKVVYIHLCEYLEQGNVVITNKEGIKVFEEKICRTNFKALNIDLSEGKYTIEVDSEKLKVKKTFHYK